MSMSGPRALFLAAPLLLLAGQVVHPDEPTEAAPLYVVLRDDRGAWTASHLLLLAGVICLIPVLLRLASAARRAAPRLSVLAAVSGVVGAGAAAALFGGSLAITEAGRGDETAMVALLDRFLESPVQALFLLVPGMLVSLGVSSGVLVATGAASRLAAGFATIGFAVGVAAPEPVACVGTTFLAVGLWLLGSSGLRDESVASNGREGRQPADAL